MLALFHSTPLLSPPPPSSRTHLAHVPHDGVLLRVNEALQHDSNGHVHVVAVNVLPQVHACVSLGDADDRLYVSHCDGDAASALGERERERERGREGERERKCGH